MKQVRNQHTGAAGITEREANQLHSMWIKLNKIQKKNNLFLGYRTKILRAMENIYEVLDESGRLEKSS